MINVHRLSASGVGINKLKTETTQIDQVNNYCRLQSNKKVVTNFMVNKGAE